MFGGIHRGIKKAYEQSGMLYQVHLDLLYQCDLRCSHCVLDNKGTPLLSTDFWRQVITEAASLDVFSLVFSGGEVFLRKDLFDLIAHARSYGIYVTIKTHGGSLDEETVQQLKALGVSAVSLSYYSSQAEIHDAITGVPGSHERTRSALERLVRAGILTVALCTVSHTNRDVWREAAAECERLGVLFSLETQVHSTISGSSRRAQQGLELADAVAVETYTQEHSCEEATEGPVNHSAWDQRKHCGAGHTSLYVSPSGEVRPCLMWPQPLGNLNQGNTLKGIWQSLEPSPLARLREARARDREVCRECQVRQDCDFCPGQAFIESHNPHAALRTACLKTRAKTMAKAARLGSPIPPLPRLLELEQVEQEELPRFRIRAVPS